MSSFMRFINNSDYPVISIYSDGALLFSDILREKITPYCTLSAGTRNLCVKQNTGKCFIDTKLSLSENMYATLVIENDTLHFIDEPATLSLPMFSYIRAANFSAASRISIMEHTILLKDVWQQQLTAYKPIISKTHTFSANDAAISRYFFEPYSNYTLYMLKNTVLITADRGKHVKHK